MDAVTRKMQALDWVGGHPGLEFVNHTKAWGDESAGNQGVDGFDLLLGWNRAAGLIGPEQARLLGRGARRSRNSTHRAALALSRTLSEIFNALIADASIPSSALEDLNRVLRNTTKWRRLVARASGVAFEWDFAGAPPAAVLGPVAWATAELLACGPLERIKQCPPPDGCRWLFLDQSKNRSRRWCSMESCGNAAKVRAHYRRQRGGRG